MTIYCKLHCKEYKKGQDISHGGCAFETKFNRKLWLWVSGISSIVSLCILIAIQPEPAKLVSKMKWILPLKGTPVHTPAVDMVISCYYNTPRDNSSAQLQPADIQADLCTHINVAFATLTNKSIHLEDSQDVALREVITLKELNPKLKVLLSVGGAGENNGFSEMVVDHASRKTFIKSMKKVLNDYNLDGIDLDWEFPVLHDNKGVSASRERQHFSQLLREIRMEYIREKKDYILSVALAAPQTIVDVAYDVDQINLYVDFANIMTYDFHYYTKFTPFTGFNSPLYARSTEELFLATLNVNYTVHMYQSKGLDRNKIVVGIPTYGHSFKLVNSENPGVGSPASGFGDVGGGGFVDYPTVCAFASAHASDVSLRFDEAARASYLYRGVDWLSYESPRSAADKAAYIANHRLRGAMIYSLNADDFRQRAFPLLRSVAGELHRAQPPLLCSNN